MASGVSVRIYVLSPFESFTAFITSKYLGMRIFVDVFLDGGFSVLLSLTAKVARLESAYMFPRVQRNRS